MSIVLFSNVKSPTSLLIHIMVSHVWGREGVCGVGVVVCLSLSLCLSGKQVGLFFWSSVRFSIKMLPQPCRLNKLVPFFAIPTSPYPSFLPPELELRTQPMSGAWDMWHLVWAFPAATSCTAAFQMCTHSLRASVAAADLEVYKWVMK